MADAAPANDTAPGKVALTLELDANVYEAFLRKAKQAEMEIEPFLSNTLTIVLGCRVFNEHYACSPAVQDGDKAKSSANVLKRIALEELCGSK